MAQLIDDVTYLSEEIGARPAGTEEEQQTALFVAETLQQDAGFQAIIEDFSGIVNPDLPKAVCFTVVFVCGLISLLIPLLTLPAGLISLIAAALLILEVVDKPVLSRFLKGGISQNVVAKYQPAGVPKKRRKIVLVANYDSGRVVPDQKGFMQANRRIFEIAYIVGIVLLPILLLLQGIVFPGASGVADGVFSFLTVVCMILVAVPVALTVVHKQAAYTGAANNNASGVAVLLDVARKVGNGCVSLEEMERMAEEAGSELEGEEAVREAGLVPDDAELEYLGSVKKAESPQDSLAAAHAAIAALTGKPVPASSAYAAAPHPNDTLNPEEIFSHDTFEEEVPVNPAEKEPENQVSAEASAYNTNYRNFTTRPSAQSEEAESQPEEQVQQPVEPLKPAPVVMTSSSASGIPSWARTAQAKARENKPEQSAPNYSLRSRYADTPAAHIQDGALHQSAASVAAASGVAGLAVGAAGVAAAAAVENIASAGVEESVAGDVQPASAQAAELSSEVASAPAKETPAVRVVEAQPETLSSDPALAARLAALRNEINSSPAPHISEESRRAFADMEAQAQKKQSVVSRETSKAQQALEQPEVSDSAVSTEAFDSNAVESALDELNKSNEAQAAVEPVDEVASADALIEAAEQADAAAADAYEPEEQVPSTTARSLRRQAAGASSAFGGFMNKVQHMAESAATAASEAGTHLGEMASNVRNASNAGSKFEQIDEAQNNDELPEQYEDEVFEAEQDILASSDEEFLEEEPVEENALAGEEAASDGAAEPKILDAMDVSAFMDKTEPEEESHGPVDDVDDETTKPVSMQEIREAMANVSNVAVPANDASEHTVSTAKPEEQVSPIVGIKLDSLPSISESKGSDQVIKLPELDANGVSQVEAGSQRAPMSQDAKRSPLASGAIPRISAGELERDSQSQSDRFGLNLPPLGAESEVSHELVSATSSFSTVGGTGAFAPVGDELVEGIPEENLYVEDADDSSFEESHTETGAYAGPEYVDMPQSRVGRLFGRFGRKGKNKKAEQESLNEWIGADEGYTAKGAGESRESWESFRDQDNSGKYEGGAFSIDNLRNLDVKSIGKRFGKGGQASSDAPVDEAFDADETKGFSVTDVADAAENVNLDAVMSHPIESSADSAADISKAMKHINEFRHPGIDTEVWFVGLGSEIGSNSGMNAFFDAHKEELDGAIIINLQALGAGRMSLIDKEGVLLPVKPSSRVKRFMRQAAERSKVGYGTAQLLSVETPGSFAIRRGYQAFSIVGVKDGKPAYYAEKEDTLDNIDVKALEDASSFVMELLKVI